MELNKQVCSLELAKKLKELGVKQESYFSWVISQDKEKRDIIQLRKTDIGIHNNPLYKMYHAFTVAELGEMLPVNIEKDGVLYWLVCKKEFLRNIERTPIYIVSYESQLYGEIGHTYLYTEADARAKMLVYLLENGLIKLD